MTSRTKMIDALNAVDWSFSRYVPQRTQSIHNIHWYPAIFFRGLVVTLLDIFQPLREDGIFLDPFSGSGVAAVEAWLRGWTATAIDNSSFADAIARAKVQLIRSAPDAEGAPTRLCRSLSESQSQAMPRLEAVAIVDEALRYFSPAMLQQIYTLRDWIRGASPDVSQWREVLRVLLSAQLHKPLSLYRDVNHSYVIDRSRTKPPTSPEPDATKVMAKAITDAFSHGWSAYSEGIARTGTLAPEPTMVRGSSPEVVPTIASEWSLTVTSPPYFGMNDYVRSAYLSHLIDPRGDFPGEIASELGPRRKRESPHELRRYLDGLEECFAALRACSAKDAVLVVIMGESTARYPVSENVQRKTLETVVRTGFQLAWSTTRQVRFRKINSTPYRTEDLWVLLPT